MSYYTQITITIDSAQSPLLEAIAEKPWRCRPDASGGGYDLYLHAATPATLIGPSHDVFVGVLNHAADSAAGIIQWFKDLPWYGIEAAVLLVSEEDAPRQVCVVGNYNLKVVQ